MNEIERAIESAQARLDNMRAYLRRTNGNEDSIAKRKRQVEIAEVTLAALREQAGRQSGCEYCKDSEDLAYGHDSMQRTGRIYLDGNLLTADLYSESMAAAICFCPVCGKRLEVKHELSDM